MLEMVLKIYLKVELLKGRKILHLSKYEPEEKKSYLITELSNSKI